MIQFLGFYHYKAAKAVAESTAVVVVVGGKAGNFISMAEHGVKEDGVFAFRAFIDRVIIVAFDRPDPLEIFHLVNIHTRPDRMVVGSEAALFL